jgi:UDP-N-acetylglucosamine 2-epimerase (non-hydrolysing)
MLPGAAAALQQMRADYVLVHGDTLTTFTVAWAAFLERIPVGHVEAGLRSHNISEPFPEEMNRRLTDALTDLDLAPTALARQNLLREGKRSDHIVVTGQTGIDAILYAADAGSVSPKIPHGRYVTVTLHRRENWPILPELCGALARIAAMHPELTFVFPVHLNPVVREVAYSVLSNVRNVVLCEPFHYAEMAALLRTSELIITDSGGLQEEGAALGVPVLVLRNVTERPEGIALGFLTIAGTDPEQIYCAAQELLGDPARRQRIRSSKNPYGDGNAGKRVAQAVAWRLGCSERPADWIPPEASLRSAAL